MDIMFSLVLSELLYDLVLKNSTVICNEECKFPISGTLIHMCLWVVYLSLFSTVICYYICMLSLVNTVILCISPFLSLSFWWSCTWHVVLDSSLKHCFFLFVLSSFFSFIFFFLLFIFCYLFILICFFFITNT